MFANYVLHDNICGLVTFSKRLEIFDNPNGSQGRAEGCSYSRLIPKRRPKLATVWV